MFDRGKQKMVTIVVVMLVLLTMVGGTVLAALAM